MWDLKPVWESLPESTAKDCERERQYLLEKLRPEDRKRTTLVCITQMLEAWPIADGAAVAKALSSPTRKVGSAANVKLPEAEKDPKARLISLYQRHHGRRPTESVFTLAIAREERVEWMKRAPSFARYWGKLGG